eukprot:CAMPEP_0176499714 /NCGR_PEP_ID=MMETSP0200_2-20121128/13091_1 /TAXON_ID=947934 /ORGANISM="Chaetoceros sp., Strain GSL56" /LENGTH=401 /DNA_ID=CAMNT_0017898185 /DNA_START=583 /DNA_END=1784 /DNA_ORIENTATION=+
MEDAHIAETNISPPPFAKNGEVGPGHAKVFAVFDGHGGAEVARFCQLYLVDVLTHEKCWVDENVDIGKALTDTFHALDRLIDCPERRNEIKRLETRKPDPKERRCVDNVIEEIDTNETDQNVNNNSANDDDDDSDAVVGENDGGHLDDDDDKDGDGSNEQTGDFTKNPMVLLKKLLNSVQAKKRLESMANSDKESSEEDTDGGEHEKVTTPTKIVNGRPMCNLSDHPIHAGCTAVCAVIVGNTLTVANAGDSRVVLCREDGVAEAMSFDHKPMDNTEMERIKKAGGFVNQFGRVNGNLNLSRSIGDLKYKQVPNIGPADQMITAEPDIKSVVLNENDEFVILACDGIWDCLTNEEAVKYVRDRIDTMTPIEIGTEMLDQIVSIDPRETQGIGGDNMTVMIV